MAEKLAIGLKLNNSTMVSAALTVPNLSAEFGDFKDMPPVFATPYLVAFIEYTCLTGLKPLLGAGERTVGTSISISHSAATPVGMKVFCEAELIELKGKLMQFKITCRDENQIISEGTHGRAIIDYEKFMSRLGQ